jgi:cytidylate kinase
MKMHAVAIDGPAGAGKSTVAKMVSKTLGYIYVDTGAMFRAVGLYLLRMKIASDDEMAITRAIKDINIVIRYEDGTQKVLLNGEDVSGLIRTEEVGNMASACSVFGTVRKKLLELQRKIAEENNVVMDGRDIGTVVLPNADTKIFLTASAHIRALRRYNELMEKGLPCNLEETEKDIIERDRRDSTRQNAPLKQAENAVLLDTSSCSAEEAAERIVEIVKAKKS